MQCLSPKSTRFNEFSSNIATALVCLATNRVYNFSKMIFDGMVRNINNKVSKFLIYPRFLSKCLKMGQFGKITHTQTYVVPFHTRKIFTTLRVNSPSFSGRIVPLFHSMLVSQGESHHTPTESHHTPTSEASQSSHHELLSPSLPLIPTESLLTVIPSDNPPLRQYTRRARIAQSLAFLPVADEPASPIADDSQGEACPTDSGLKADQDRANIAKTSTLPSDSKPRVTSLAADEGSMQQKLDELTTLCTSLQRQQSEMISMFEAQELEINSLKAKIKLLEDKDGGVAEQSGDDALIKGRRLDEVEEATERVRVPTAAEVATATVSIPTGSGVVSTASPTIPTAALIFTTATDSIPYTRRKGKEKMIASTAEIARIHAEEELQMLIDGLDRNNETISKYLQEYHQFAAELPIERRIELISDLVKYQDNYAKYFKGMTLEEINKKFDPVWKHIQDFVPIGSKEEAERFKRKGLRLEQESVKKLKTSEERSYWKIIRLGGSSARYQFFVDMLKHLDREDLNQLWELVKETLSIRPATIEWKLYDTCGVHHVTSKDKEIFMLVEKDYPLRKGLEIGMISYKLQVENYSKMANDLILKIYKIDALASEQSNKEDPPAIDVTLIRFPVKIQMISPLSNPPEDVDYQSSGRLCNLRFLDYSKLYFFEYEHVALNSTRHGLDDAAIGKPACLAALAILVTGASQSRQHDLIVHFDFSDQRLEQSVTFSIPINSETTTLSSGISLGRSFRFWLDHGNEYLYLTTL
nr:hypothetical protein [Tanacetum cinerariifolium]